MTNRADFKPYRSLAAAVMLEAHRSLTHSQSYEHQDDWMALQAQARRYFLNCLDDPPVPFNLNFCCEVLELDRAAVVEKVKELAP
jgi:hypothetical protein